MYYNRFSVRILGGREIHSGYVKINHGQVFRLVLKNDYDEEADATVKLNGIEVGQFRIHSRSTIILERGVNDDGRFTFFASGTAEANQAGLSGIDVSQRGLVQVTFIPGKVKVEPVTSVEHHHHHWYPIRQWPPTPQWTYDDDSIKVTWKDSTCNCSSADNCMMAMASPADPEVETYRTTVQEGIVGLSGQSNQSFRSVEPLEYDYSRQTTITLRLISNDGAENIDARPVVSSGNPVPPPVGDADVPKCVNGKWVKGKII